MEQTRNRPQSYEKNNIIVDPRGKTKEGGGGTEEALAKT